MKQYSEFESESEFETIYYPIVETFVSINGEGRFAGELAVFIRFRTCNLCCSYCDTQWANAENAPAQWMNVKQLVKFVADTGVSRVTLTGGEPLLQEHLDILIAALVQECHSNIEIETNGSVSIQKLSAIAPRPVFTLDYKLPSSNMESHMLVENYQYLTQEDVVKFVIGTTEDMERALQVIREHQLLQRCQVYFSPVYQSIQPAELVAFMEKHTLNQVRVQLQLHKFIWNPEERRR